MNPCVRQPAFAAEVNKEGMVRSDYDLVFVALGYEARSSHFAEIFKGNANVRVAAGFNKYEIHSFDSNKNILLARGFEIEDVSDADFLPWWLSVLTRVTKDTNGKPIKICIDISSLSRLRLAQVLEGLVTDQTAQGTIQVDFAYTVAAFSAPAKVSESATTCGPVSSFFAGWPSDPEQPIAALIGLGYELEKAIGALEYLEPTTQILLTPISPDLRFDEEVGAANITLLDRSAVPRYSYPVDHPTECLELIDALCYSLSSQHRLISIPFGPKIFALCCMLVACRSYPRLGVWRISSEDEDSVRDQVASEHTFGLTVRFDRRAINAD